MIRDYWYGFMDWPIDRFWVCETCGKYQGLEWGLIHSECRCEKCHTPYWMRDKDDKIVRIPISNLKPEYKNLAKIGWKKYGTPIDSWDKEKWNELRSQPSPGKEPEGHNG